MGFFSKIFGGKAKSIGTSVSFLSAYREAGGQSPNGGGWGLDRFNSVVDAYAGVEDMVEEWSLDGEDSDYMSLDGYSNCYEQAWQEEYDKAEFEADMLSMFGIDVNPEELMDYDVIEEHAYEYACELAQAWLDGDEWIPEEIMDWAWYDLSDHNM